MKKKLLKFLSITLLLLTFFSCSNLIDTNVDNDEMNVPLKYADIEQYNASAPDVQKQFWIDRVTNFSHSVSLTSTGQDVINVLLDFLEGLDFSDPDVQTTASSFVDSWIEDALSVFSMETIGLLVGTPTREYTDIVNFYNGNTPTYAVDGSGASGGSGGSDNCNCNTSSSWGACQLIGDKCAQNNTCETGKGCGFVGLWTCNGECDGGPTGGQTTTGGSVYSYYYYVPNVTLIW